MSYPRLTPVQLQPSGQLHFSFSQTPVLSCTSDNSICPEFNYVALLVSHFNMSISILASFCRYSKSYVSLSSTAPAFTLPFIALAYLHPGLHSLLTHYYSPFLLCHINTCSYSACTYLSSNINLDTTVMLGPGRDKCRPSEVKGLSHSGLLVMRTHARISWQGSMV